MKLFNMLTKHLSGQHDQASHGRRGSNVSESSSSKDRGIELYKPQKIVNEKYTLHEDGWIEYHDTSLKRRMEKLDNIADTYIYDANSKTMKTLVDAFKTSDGRRYNEIQIENLKNTNPEKFNAKGDLTIYRGGIIRSGYNSFSIDKDTAINYMVFNYGSNRGQREGTTSGRKLIEISISPEKIIALIGGGEVIIHSSKIKEKKEVKLFDILTKGGSGSGSWSGPGQPRFSHNSSVKKLDNKLISSIKDYAKNSIGTLKERLVIVKIDTKEVLADYEQELYLTNELTHERTSISGFSNANTFDANGNLHPDSSILDIHTHPENSSFSEGDWKIFVNSTIGEARIFSPDNEYILTKTKEFTSMDWTKRTPRVINEVYNRILADVEKDFSSIQISESYKFDKYVEEVIHEVSNRMSKEFNVNYIVNSDKSKKSLFDMIYKGGQGSGNFGHAGRPGEIGGSSDSGGGSFPKDAKDITSEQAMKQANYQDIKSQMKKNLSEIKQGESKQIDVSGELDSKTASNIEKNMKSELSLYGNYLAGDTMATARDYIDDFREVLNKGIKDGSLKDIKAEDLNKLGIDNVNKLIHQEIESNRQAFTDHGIRHIVGDVLRQRQIMREMNPEVTAKQELMGDFAMLNHDIGYTVPLIREGGERGIAMTKKHPLFSQKITEEQRDIWNKDKIFSVEEYNKITEVIKTHDSTKIDKNDILSTSSRISDNLSLFSKEKLPSVFKYVSGGDTYLVNMGIAAEKKDTASFEKHKKDLYKKIDESNISTSLKRDLKMATREIGFLTPKFTLGVLAGEIDSIKKESGKINISIQYNSYDAKMQKLFDMGQKQTKKFLEENGVTDFSKTKYDIGDMLRLEVKGYKEEKRLFDIVGKHLSGQHDQLSHGRRGSNVSESRINNSKPLEEIKSKFSDEDIPYGDWGSPLDSGKELYGWRGEGAGGSFGNSEGNGRYIAKEENLASFFGKPTRVRFIPPQNPFIVDNEPLYLLMESDELVAPVSKKDSIWLQVSKLAAKESERKLKGKWDAEDVGNRLTDILKKKGFDGVRVRSGGDEWVVIFDNAPIKSLLDILTKGGAGSGNFGHAGRPGAIGGSNANGSSKETIGRKDTNTPDEKQLKETVEQFNSFNPTKINNLKYKGLYDIVSKEGRFFTPEKQPRPKDIPKGEDKDCYRNTTLLAISNPDKYTYVEGIAFSKGINGLPFEHAWCIDNKTKKVIETTWKESGTAYYGVPFNSEYVMKMTFKNKVYGLMAGYSSGVKDIYENGFPENAIKKESKKVKSLFDIVGKHLSGQHDQLSHGRRGSNISESRNSSNIITDVDKIVADYLPRFSWDKERPKSPPLKDVVFRVMKDNEFENIKQGERSGSFWSSDPTEYGRGAFGESGKESDDVLVVAKHKKEWGQIYRGLTLTREEADVAHFHSTHSRKMEDIIAVYKWDKETKLKRIYPEENKKFFLEIITKGGQGSGSWESPGQPRFNKQGIQVLNEKELRKNPKEVKKIHEEMAKQWDGDRRALGRLALYDICEEENKSLKGMLIKDGIETVGVVAYEKSSNGKDIHLAMVATKRKGYGRNLVKDIVKIAVRKNMGIRLFSDSDAIPFYDAIGFKKKGESVKGRGQPFAFTYKEAKAWLGTQKKIYEDIEPESGIFVNNRGLKKKEVKLFDIIYKGGRGSGNFGHAGRPGQIGGSELEGNILITSKPSGFENDKNILSKEGTVVNYDANFLKQEKALSKRIKNEVRLWGGDRGDLAEAAVKEMSTPDSEYSEYRGIITKDKGEIVGTINYEFDRDKIYIHEIATKKKGYGENLIREVLKKAVENKIGIELFSTKEAADYYRKIGLKPKGRVPKGRAGIFELNYLEAKGWLTMHKSKYTEFEPESGCFADSRKVRDKRRRQIEKVSFTKMICDKIAGIKKEVNLFKEISLLDMLTKHFSGQHDQLSHGRRGGSNISESRTEKPAGSSRAGQSGKGGIGTWKPVLVKTTKVKVMNKKGIPIIDKETGKQKMKTKYTFLQENGKPLPKYMEGWSWRPNMKDPLYLQVDNPKDLKKIKVLAQGRVEGVLKDKWQCGLYKNPNGEKNTKTEGDYKKITVLDKNFNKVYAKNEKNRNSRDAGIRERADLTKLIMHSGIRVGGKEEENAAMRSATSKKIGEEVYGASTLLGKHVVKEGGAVYLRFPAKSGVLYDYEITDKSIAKMMIDRAKKAGAKGNVFNQDAVEYGKTSSYMKGLDSKQYTAKNFRTLTANRIAQKKISSMKKPKTKKEYIDSVNKVGITVGTVLGHRSKVPIYKKDKAGKPIKVKDKKTGKMVKVSTGKFEYKVSASTSIKNYISPALFKQWGEF